MPPLGIDLTALRDRLRAALPPLAIELVELEHSETRVCYPALLIETDARKKGCVYRMTVTVLDDEVNFFVHVHGTSKDLTTQGAACFTKAGVDLDEVSALVLSCWRGGAPS